MSHSNDDGEPLFDVFLTLFQLAADAQDSSSSELLTPELPTPAVENLPTPNTNAKELMFIPSHPKANASGILAPVYNTTSELKLPTPAVEKPEFINQDFDLLMKALDKRAPRAQIFNGVSNGQNFHDWVAVKITLLFTFIAIVYTKSLNKMKSITLTAKVERPAAN